ncbi:CUE domain-containing protein [Amycolatopsis tolypomycina]|uniref:CUE domain-containing protein n=1 Tax=Amycolatopsis tolypomycina TaxID=208445 RepID=UPI001FCA1355|nr:CUE domain-containing protein [Amycolatopsis tolypomycina]
MPYPLPVPGAFGLWIAFADADRILFQQHTTAAHQDHIILHEVGHMISGHSTEGGATGLAALFPDIPPEVVRDALRRDGYSLVAEREAEMVATVIKEWATLLEALKFSPVQGSKASRRLHGAFDDHQGWL